MKKVRLFLSTGVAAAAMLFFTGTGIAAEHEHAMKVGKTGDVTFDKETKVGDLTLKPGRYMLQHRIEGREHVVHFTEWSQRTPWSPITLRDYAKADAGEAECGVEELNKTVAETTIWTTDEGNGVRVTKVEIAGENVAHMF